MRVDLIVIHCSATPNGRPVTVEQIREWHLDRGFQGVGYHFVITIDGMVHGTRPETTPGAHAKGYNACSLGVCMVGGTGGADPLNPGAYSAEQWEALRSLLWDLRVRYPDARICGHRDLSPDIDGDGQIEPHEWIKLCPSFDVAGWLGAGMVPDPKHVLFHPE